MSASGPTQGAERHEAALARRWTSHPWMARLLRALVILVPILTSFAFSIGAGRVAPAAELGMNRWLWVAIVFGLSMDYEVFLLSRIKEEYERTGDARNSVADGLASTARVISAAAAIMIVVFGSFMFEDNRIIKLFGLGLAMAVFLDASLVRLLLVPATMELLGTKNWWLPRWLDRIVPNLNIEGTEVPPPDIVTGHRDEPEPHDESEAVLT